MMNCTYGCNVRLQCSMMWTWDWDYWLCPLWSCRRGCSIQSLPQSASSITIIMSPSRPKAKANIFSESRICPHVYHHRPSPYISCLISKMSISFFTCRHFEKKKKFLAHLWPIVRAQTSKW
ncbi:hypothetical protein BC827DRAFT_39840 [Russula dissimulans]|nr:hypothetical protein BC827DRAFT_39840 [Russula dissimulans]